MISWPTEANRNKIGNWRCFGSLAFVADRKLELMFRRPGNSGRCAIKILRRKRNKGEKEKYFFNERMNILLLINLAQHGTPPAPCLGQRFETFY
jgi:hypothetical protein